MSAWIVITEANLNDYLVGAQMDALKTAALAAGQADPFTAIMPDIIARIRLKIQSCARNRLSLTANSVPPECKWIACYLIIEAMQVRLPIKVRPDFATQLQEAKKQLDRMADCKDVVSLPNDPEGTPEAQTSAGITLVNSTCREASREKLDGI